MRLKTHASNRPLKGQCIPLVSLVVLIYPISQRRTMYHSTIKKSTSIIQTRVLAMAAMLSAISFVLAFLEFPVPLSPSFAKMDLSDFPALIGAFAFGPVAGVLIELVKNVLQLMTTSTGGIGELANFIMGSSFVFTAGMIYRLKKSKSGAITACLAASVVMGIVAAATNYFLLLPVFHMFMPIYQLIASFGTLIPFIQTKLDVVLYNALPFNLLKGLALSLLAMLTYKQLAPSLKGKQS